MAAKDNSERVTRIDLDELDRKILQAYLFDARLSYRELAHKLGVSTTTIQSRTNKLEKLGVIRGYSAVFDHEKVGFQLTAITEVSVAKGKLLELEREVAKIPQVLAVYDVTGLTDAMVIAKFKSREELSKFTKSLLAMPFVERTNTHIVLTTVKEDFRLL
ncbi:MAG TPA: Lrp/AsnC family transcriptional regulator [Candidatus Bathyarchaeia archaeon]|nr:Lrp/AsnC family transcriptional regulator [Candidatus Bathyarchaeia archaeon]